ncbi:MAG: hypothetical protein EOP07_21595 [Proteobacteria bacterium]|nr:MAG: hypothetical protein EOP07_21595 [Pseudomonadota bacterium]
MKIQFEHDYQNKIMTQAFTESFTIKSDQDVQAWRQLWMDALKSWHSPYKSVIDGRNLSIASDANKEQIKSAFVRLEKLMSGFFLKKAVFFGLDPELAAVVPFDSFVDEDAAMDAAGVRTRVAREPGDFRSSIQFQNHFRQHVVEMNFGADTVIDTKEKVQILRSKMTNNLMHWHSAWSLLIDCSQLEIKEECFPEFESMVRFMKGFFLKEVLGYQPKVKDLVYPFKVYRARHNAAGRLEAEGLFSGEDANCKTRKAD